MYIYISPNLPMKKEDNKFEEYHLELHNWKAVHSGLSQGHYESKCCNVWDLTLPLPMSNNILS